MADVYNKSLSWLDSSGNRQIFTISGVETNVDELETRVDNLESGSIQFAEKDYSQSVNQGEMVVGVTYLVAFNDSGTFVQADSSDVAYFDKYKKDSGGTVKLIGRQYPSADLQNVAYTNKSNTFTESQLMKSSEGNWDSINVNKLVTKSEVALKIDAIEDSITDITDGTTQIEVQDATEAQKGIIQLASQAEVDTGTNAIKAVTPATLQAKIDAVLSGGDDGEGGGASAIAYTNKANTFTPAQTFTGGATITSKRDWASVGANNLVSKTEVGYELTRIDGLIDAVEESVADILDGTEQITIPDATESQKGIVQLASTTEVTTGTDTAKAVTAAGVQAAREAMFKGVESMPEASGMQKGVLYFSKS